MARSGDVGEPETSDDDSISLTSTVSSAKTERYEVQCIVAERKTKGAMEYLTAWKDYPEHRHTWEPRECFFEDDVFSEWTRTKMRISRGLEKPFDVKGWKKRCKSLEKETLLRRKRRRDKKLRLGNHEDLTSEPEEQDANIESSGSEPRPRRSEKRIKRRSVHQDAPPSSSISDLSSSSSSEDSDRPLMSRQESEVFTPLSKWTQAETIALEEGLRSLKVPRWRELLSLYGRNGTISQVLKDKTPSDLYDKAKSVRQEFVDSGREPPEYLKPFSKSASSRGSGTATPTIYSESKVQSRAASKKSSRSTSVDSMMAELRDKQLAQEERSRENSRPQQTINSKENLQSARGWEKNSETAEKVSSRTSKAPQAPVRKVEMSSGKKTLIENSTATQPKSHPETTVPNTNRTTEAKENTKNDASQGRQLKDVPQTKELSKTSAILQAERQSGRLAPGTEKTAKHTTDAATHPEHSRQNVLKDSKTLREETARTTWSGTARAPTIRPSVSKPSRLGAVGSGPARSLSSSKLKPKLGQIEPKKPVVVRNVTAAWNAEPKRRKSNNWATTNDDPANGQAPKRNYRLSVQNKIYKGRRDGRAPDPNRLVFLDPKTGKAPTTVPAPSPTAMLSKTPLQLHQEELAAREAEERRAQEAEDIMHISTGEADPPQGSIDQHREKGVGDQSVSGTGGTTSDTSASALKTTAADMTNVPASIDSLTSPPLASPNLVPPLNVPLGPRIQTKRTATMSLQDYTKRSIPSTHLLDEAAVNPHLNDPPRLTLRNYPSLEHKSEIFNKPDPTLVIGDIKLGKDDQENKLVKFVGFGFETHKLLLSIKSMPRTMHFVLEAVCQASEYRVYFPAEASDYLGSGSIVAYHQSEPAVEHLAETLANNMQGGLFFAPQFTMLMYPAGASTWAFLDEKLPKVHPGTTLRFVVRRPLTLTPADVHGLATSRLANEDPERYAEITNKIQKAPIQTGEKNINVVFRDMFEIDFGRLVAQNGPQSHPPTNIFFLCFIPQGCEDYEPDPAKRSALRKRTSEEHDLFIKFLKANGAEEIYSMQDIGSQDLANNAAWGYFTKAVKSGTIIFHDAFIRYDLIPRLAKHLLRGSVNVWKTSLSPMHPGEKHPHLVRLFPHGGVLLLTESLVLYQPREALRMLMWLRRVQIPCKAPGTWKVAVRPRFREWILDIMDAYVDSGKDIFGCSIQTFADIYTEVYWLLQKPDPGDNNLMCYEWDYETPTEEAPIVSSSSLRALQARKEWKGAGTDTEPNDDHIRQNDDLLIQWFAEWAIVNLQSFRKYNVILGYAKDHPFTETAISAYEKAWGHIEVMTCEDACTTHKVTAQTELEEMEAQRRKKVKDALPAKRAAANKARKEEREAAKAALEVRMQTFRDVGATEEEVLRAGRLFLRDWGGSEKEIEECGVDMDRVFVDRWWEDSVMERGGDANMDTSEAAHGVNDDDATKGMELALPRTQKYLADRKRARASREASAAGSDRVQSMDVSG